MKMLTDKHTRRQTDVRMTRQTHILKKKLAQVVSFNPGFKSICGNVFELEFGKYNRDRCVHTQNGQMEGHQLQKHLSPGGVLSTCKVSNQLNKASSSSSPETKIFQMSTQKTAKWTDTTFKSNLALVMLNDPVKFQIDRTKYLLARNQNILDECKPKTGKCTDPA